MFIEQNDITSTHDTSPGLYFCDVLVVVYSYTAVPYCYQRIPQIHLVWIQTMSEWKCAFCFPNLTKQFLLSQHTIIGHNTKKKFRNAFLSYVLNRGERAVQPWSNALFYSSILPPKHQILLLFFNQTKPSHALDSVKYLPHAHNRP